jgi:hypothetical protein
MGGTTQEKIGGQDVEFILGGVALGAHAPGLNECRALIDAHDRVGVAHVDNENHP